MWKLYYTKRDLDITIYDVEEEVDPIRLNILFQFRLSNIFKFSILFSVSTIKRVERLP